MVSKFCEDSNTSLFRMMSLIFENLYPMYSAFLPHNFSVYIFIFLFAMTNNSYHLIMLNYELFIV